MPHCHVALGFNIPGLTSHREEELPPSIQVTSTSASPGQPCLNPVEKRGPSALSTQLIQSQAPLFPIPR